MKSRGGLFVAWCPFLSLALFCSRVQGSWCELAVDALSLLKPITTSNDMQTQKRESWTSSSIFNAKPFKSHQLMTSWASSHSLQTLMGGQRSSAGHQELGPRWRVLPGRGKVLWAVMAGLSPSCRLAQELVELCGKPKLGSSFRSAWKSSRQCGLAVRMMPLMLVAYKTRNLQGSVLVRW